MIWYLYIAVSSCDNFQIVTLLLALQDHGVVLVGQQEHQVLVLALTDTHSILMADGWVIKERLSLSLKYKENQDDIVIDKKNWRLRNNK